MEIIQQVLFILLSGVAIFLFAKKVKEITDNIRLGRDEKISGNKKQRWKNLLLLAFGQKKMFRYPLVGILHFAIYAGFIIICISDFVSNLSSKRDGFLESNRLLL